MGIEGETDEAPKLEAGTVLAGKFFLMKPLAAGGMGQVWFARNLATSAEVAIKVILPGHASPVGLERFRREARAAATLQHRAIVRVFDFVELDPTRGSMLLVMELLHGLTIAETLQWRGRLSVEETIEIAFPLLSALSLAHERGIVHRDLKPENVILTIEPDGQRVPKILDFGISKHLGASRITRDGEVLGTPSYMSPEQTLAQPVDPRSDVFLMGILLYECLSARHPFVVAGELALTSMELLRTVLDVEPPPLDHVPAPIWAVLRRALAKNSADRFASTAEMAGALRVACALAKPPSRLARRRRAAMGMTCAAAALAFAGVGFTSSRVVAHGRQNASFVAHAKRAVRTLDVLAEREAESAASVETPTTVLASAPPKTEATADARRVRRIRVLRDPGF